MGVGYIQNGLAHLQHYTKISSLFKSSEEAGWGKADKVIYKLVPTSPPPQMFSISLQQIPLLNLQRSFSHFALQKDLHYLSSTLPPRQLVTLLLLKPIQTSSSLPKIEQMKNKCREKDKVRSKINAFLSSHPPFIASLCILKVPPLVAPSPKTHIFSVLLGVGRISKTIRPISVPIQLQEFSDKV